MTSRLALLFLLTVSSVSACLAQTEASQAAIVQISDTHIADQHAPHARENLKQAVSMVNDRHPDAVILSGDIGENPEAWEEAKSILKAVKAPLYFVPGNHDVHSKDLERYRRAFGKDYYTFEVKNVTVVAIDSQLLGNYDVYEARTPLPLPEQTQKESERMLDWLAHVDERIRPGSARVLIGVQHIPVYTDGSFPDPKPYWVVSEPYRSREMTILRKLGIRDMLVGHWHNARVFQQDGITWHVAPATSWLPWGGELGFAMHRIDTNGKVHTEFVSLPGAVP